MTVKRTKLISPQFHGGAMNTRRRGVLSALLWLFLASCDPFTHDPAAFFEEQTGGITLGLPAVADGTLALGTDGYICLKAGETGFSIPIDNPQGYALTVESSFTQTLGAGISGLTVTQSGADRLAVNIPEGNIAGNEGTLHIKVKTAAEGRILYEGDLRIAYLADFNTTLTEITPSDPLTLNPSFDPQTPNYSVSNAPDTFYLGAVAANPQAFVTIDGMTGIGRLDNRAITPAANISTVLLRVELPHGAAARNYSVVVNRTGSGVLQLAVNKSPNKTVYQVQGAGNTGIDTTGLKISLGAESSWTELDPSQYTLGYDFTTPGPKDVTVTYNAKTELTTSFPAWVVGLSGLSLTGPGGYAPALNFDQSSAVTYNKNLGTIANNINALSITATSGVADVPGSTLSITRTAPSTEGGAAVSGTAKTINLANGANTIEITVGLTKESQTVTRTYTIIVSRAALADGAEFFVSGSDVSPPGSETGDGSAAAPYAKVQQVLDLVINSGLESIPDAYITITISGTITADTGTSNGMIDISGTGYPKIVLQGKGPGANAGVINAAGKSKRVLYIADGSKVSLGANLTLRGGAPTGDSYAGKGGGGVFVSGSTFKMTGGTIAYNTASTDGGGVFVSGSSFEMTGGTIAHNTASFDGGGVCVTHTSTFKMTGGTIEYNTASNNGGGGGVYVVLDSAFEMAGGTIAYNTASTSGGGVFVSGTTFEMTGGTIAHNTASSDGGGVYVNSGTFETSGTALIKGNKAAWGGGVFVTAASNSMFTKKGNALIYGDTDTTHTDGSNENTATSGNGHVVCLMGGKKRNDEADATVNLYAKDTSAWSYNDTSVGGVGDTTANWE
ncbi:MAG: cadherin-like beta sandwich domain-containing protein [Spirochaetaceae bacterium]|nr:cadherin-like beta sandwich domain-containing protein [Spirochaetaceae bacterium]